MNPTRPFVDFLLKTAGVEPEEARRALDRLEGLEKNRPTVGQVARYSALGAVAGPGLRVVRNVLEGGKKWHDFGGVSPARGALGAAVTGALASGAVPLLRGEMDRRADMGKLRAFMAQHPTSEPVKTAGRAATALSAARSVADIPDFPKGNVVGALMGKASDFSKRRIHHEKKEGSVRFFLTALSALE